MRNMAEQHGVMMATFYSGMLTPEIGLGYVQDSSQHSAKFHPARTQRLPHAFVQTSSCPLLSCQASLAARSCYSSVILSGVAGCERQECAGLELLVL